MRYWAVKLTVAAAAASRHNPAAAFRSQRPEQPRTDAGNLCHGLRGPLYFS
jgi:hypothetical protein